MVSRKLSLLCTRTVSVSWWGSFASIEVRCSSKRDPIEPLTLQLDHQNQWNESKWSLTFVDHSGFEVGCFIISYYHCCACAARFEKPSNEKSRELKITEAKVEIICDICGCHRAGSLSIQRYSLNLKRCSIYWFEVRRAKNGNNKCSKWSACLATSTVIARKLSDLNA